MEKLYNYLYYKSFGRPGRFTSCSDTFCISYHYFLQEKMVTKTNRENDHSMEIDSKINPTEVAIFHILCKNQRKFSGLTYTLILIDASADLT